MKVREKHLPSPTVNYDEIAELFQKEYDEAYKKVSLADVLNVI